MTSHITCKVTLLAKKFGRLIFGLDFFIPDKFRTKISDTVIKISKDSDFSLKHAKWMKFLAQNMIKAKTSSRSNTLIVPLRSYKHTDENMAASNVSIRQCFS